MRVDREAARRGRWPEIVGRASIIHERLHSTFEPRALAEWAEDLSDARLARWCETAASGDYGVFERLLEFDNLDFDSARRSISPVTLAEGVALPQWAELLDRGMAAHAGNPAATLASVAATVGASPHCYAEVWNPLLAVAFSEVQRRSGKAYQLLSTAAMAEMDRALLHSLADLSRKTLEFELAVWEAGTQATTASMVKGVGEGDPLPNREFLAWLRTDGLFDLCCDYPVLARLAGTITSLWIDVTVEFLKRLSNDLAEIRAMFQPDRELSRVVRVVPSLSDRHHGGRSVMLLRFDSGLAVIYKPRDLGIEAAYSRLLDWLNRSGLPSPLRGPRVLHLEGYGWVEYIEECACADEHHEAIYYHRCGETLCLAYVLGAIDLHADNLVADQDDPVLVDLETIMHAQVNHAPTTERGMDSEGPNATESVMRTGLLPFLITLDSGDLSGIGGHRLGPDASPADLKRHHEVILDGFNAMYQHLCSLRDRFFTGDCPFGELLGQTVRFIFRPTEMYATLLGHLTSPGVLRDGADFGIEMGVLSRIGLPYDASPPFWPLLREEAEALKRFDIPHFLHPADSSRLSLGKGLEIQSFFSESAADSACRRIRSLSERDRRTEAKAIAGAIFSDVAYQPSGYETPACSFGPELENPFSADELLREAVRIGESIVERAVEVRGCTTWLTPEVTDDDRFRCLTTVPESVFTGTCGIALFLGFLGSLSGRRDFLEVARKAVQPVRTAEIDVNTAGATGCGSVIYAFTRLAPLLDAPELIHDAHTFAERLGNQRTHFPICDDVVRGTAGDLLGILALFEQSTSPAVRLSAASRAHKLVKHARAALNNGSKFTPATGWGFAHGAVGIGYALARFSAVTGDRSARKASRVLLTNASLAVAGSASDPLWMSWCNGSVGVALAHLSTLRLLGSPGAKAELQRFIDAAALMDLGPLDSLCCGNMGRVELFLKAGQALRQEKLLRRGRVEVSRVLARARAQGRYAISEHPFHIPGLFKGMAGVGYMLLRAAYPERVPSVALWE